MSKFNSIKGGKYSFVKIIAVLAALLVAVSVFMVSCGDSGSSEENVSGGNNVPADTGNDTGNDISDEVVITETAEYSTIYLYPDREVAPEDFQAFSDAVDKRLSYYGDDYIVSNYSGYIEVYFDKSMVGSTVNSRASAISSIFDTTDYSFGVVVDVADEPNWQTEESKMGKNQVTYMYSNAVIFEYCIDEYGRDDEYEDFVEYEALVKEKLDALGIDYMFGTAAYDPYTYCIKVYPEDFAPDFARVVFSNNEVSLFTTYEDMYSYCVNDMEVVNEEGFYALRYSTYYSPEELAEKYTFANDKIYLVINDVTVASASLSDMYKLDYWYIDFKDFLCFDSAEITEDDLGALNMFATVENSEYNSYFSGEYLYRYSEEYSNLGELDWKYSSFTTEDNRVSAIVSDMGHYFAKQIDGRNEVTITVNVPYDKNLAQTFIDEVKALYTACNFDSCAYNEIEFVVAGETDENPSNVFRIVAEKDSYDADGMELEYSVYGPKYNKYSSTFRDIYNADSFFTDRA